ncbi:hypothetical protein TRFO_25066 [Tritrichomonas foetus]|uniref:Ubiquitin-like domain-containing protein n=1 Tax=Tritrichomonas foetus TaxID=1144522 RepID=A0A1J4K5Y8_9EUKA|nr:hypothetical protein TRFO_25066 [Tritrichomonas foetus]|eukprot:OHT06823.1 hypothetical protein TRFO_25066 [Tritrichomonas foetus]
MIEKDAKIAQLIVKVADQYHISSENLELKYNNKVLDSDQPVSIIKNNNKKKVIVETKIKKMLKAPETTNEATNYEPDQNNDLNTDELNTTIKEAQENVNVDDTQTENKLNHENNYQQSEKQNESNPITYISVDSILNKLNNQNKSVFESFNKAVNPENDKNQTEMLLGMFVGCDYDADVFKDLLNEINVDTSNLNK